jgi:hypothetical protein
MKDESYVRYDRIRFSEYGDRFDPFNIHGPMHVKNSYISVGAASSFLMESEGNMLKRSQIYNQKNYY